MAEEITSLKLKIDVQSVDEANRKLDDFSKTAENAASATDDLTAAKKRASNITAEELKDFERVYQNAVKGVKAARAAAAEERKLAAVRKQLSESGDKLYVSFRNQLDSLKNVNTASKELERIKSSLNKIYKAGQIDINNYSQLLSDIAIKSKEVTTAETIATKAKTDFLNKLKEQLVTQNMTREQLLKYRAAQLGVSSSADFYIKKLNQAVTATRTFSSSSRLATNAAAKMQMQLIKGNFSGMNSLGMSMIMKNGIGNTFSTLLTSLNPVNIGISALVGFLGSMIPKLFESESATDKLAAAQERLNKALSTDKSGITFLSDEMTQLLKKSPSLVKALLKNSEKDAQTAIANIKTKFQESFSDMESFLTEYPIIQASNGQSGLDSVLQQIQRIKESGQDLNAMFKSTDYLTFDAVIGIQGKIEAYAEYFGITKEQAQDLLVELSNIKAETDSIKAEEKITQLIEKVSQLYITAGGNNSKFESFINGLKAIATEAGEATMQLKVLRLFTNDPNKGADPKKSPFYQYAQMIKTSRQRADEEIAAMKEAARKANEIFKEGEEGYASKDAIIKSAAAIRAQNAERGSSATNLLHISQQQEISLMAQLKALREQSLTVNTITSERKKYYDLQAQIQVLESTGDKSKLSAQEKYVLSHKEALLAQYAKNAAIGEEIAQYETATKALRKMQEYATNMTAKVRASQATFGMTSKNTNRYNEMSELDAQRDIALKGTTNPNEIAKVTEEYDKAKQALQQSWQQEDINQGDWVTGLKVGIEEYAESAKNAFSSFRDFSQQSLNSVSSAMTEFVTTGKMNFNSLTKSILTNLIEIINKMLLAQTIEAAMGWMSFGGGGGGGKATGGLQQAYTGGYIRGYATGGTVGELMSRIGYTGRGNKYEPAGIVHKGEFVFTKEATKRIGVGNLYELMNSAQKGYAEGGYVNVSPAPIVSMQKTNKSSGGINVTTNVAVNMASGTAESSNANVDPKQLENQVTAIIQQRVNETVQKLVSPGGDLYNLIRSR